MPRDSIPLPPTYLYIISPSYITTGYLTQVARLGVGHILGPLEDGEDVLVAPSFHAKLGPLVVVVPVNPLVDDGTEILRCESNSP